VPGCPAPSSFFARSRAGAFPFDRSAWRAGDRDHRRNHGRGRVVAGAACGHCCRPRRQTPETARGGTLPTPHGPRSRRRDVRREVRGAGGRAARVLLHDTAYTRSTSRVFTMVFTITLLNRIFNSVQVRTAHLLERERKSEHLTRSTVSHMTPPPAPCAVTRRVVRCPSTMTYCNSHTSRLARAHLFWRTRTRRIRTHTHLGSSLDARGRSERTAQRNRATPHTTPICRAVYVAP
jgi:hypothetical protein